MISIGKLKPWILTQDNVKLNLFLTGRKGNVLNYSDKGKRISLSVRIEENDGVNAVYVEATINQEMSGGADNMYFNPDCAVGLDLDSLGEIKGYMANYLYSDHWCRPFFDNDITKVPNNTQALLCEDTDGLFGFLLPVCGEKYKCTINGFEGGLTFKLYSWIAGMRECNSLAFVYGVGEEPFSLAESCTSTGLKLAGNGCKVRWEREYPELFEYLGWCSWDSMQIRVNECGLLEKCEEFRSKGIPVKWVILDDMWAEVKGLNEAVYNSFEEMVVMMHNSSLYSFEADHARFPNGLKGCICAIKSTYDLQVGMWHPTTGYWKGVDPDGEVAEKYSDILIKTSDGRLVHSPEYEKAYRFYHSFHTFLKSCGADFVKIDNQSFIRSFFKGIIPVGEAAGNLHKAIERSVEEHFDKRLINCMGMAQENMWNRPDSAISRCSDDFLPENREWFIKHITQCCYNSFVQGNFLWSDYDMWWTDDAQALKNSLLRAISGGPIYISDKIGRSKKEILMTLILSDGRIMRCDRPAMPTRDCITKDPERTEKPFKVWSRCGNAGVIAAFNLDQKNRQVGGKIYVTDICGLEGERFAVFEYFSRKVTILNKYDSVEITLNNQDDFKLFIIAPLINGWAPIGLIDKFISPKTIEKIDGNNVSVYEGGIFAFVSEKPVIALNANNKPCSPKNDGPLYLVDCRDYTGKIAFGIIM